ncbi:MULTISPECIES: hypothetical protein [Paraburkholderia]|uniref:Uncharacterized protein n=1 Tax=Paraburkholderia sartisoli TaxID=83784 RepID=A0A1H4C488_9BURK|nr:MULTISPECIES: hypothetical protein [Paraburkholderia]SEA54902.1 hypothetical protein SAMN05192564_10296 [Paraburkholderia sartisoli]
MAESMVSIVVGLAAIVVAVLLVASRYRREHRALHEVHHARTRLDGHRLWDRMRHRH